MTSLRAPPSSSGPVPSGFFALRTPLLPWGDFLAWGEGLVAGARRGPDVEDALAADRRLLRERLRAQVARPEVREALFVASPSLEGSLEAWLRAPDSETGQKVERSLVRYLSRMATRATPFGLFAGCSVGRVGVQTELRLPPRAAWRRHTRLDMDYVDALTEALAGLPQVRPALTYRPNTSLCLLGGRWRYAEVRRQGQTRSYHLVAVEQTPYLESTLERARAGATLGQLAQALVDAEAGVDLAEAEAYVGSLVDSQLLVSELAPAVTGEEPIHGLLARAHTLPGLAPVAEALTAVRDGLLALDAGGLGSGPHRYLQLAAALAPLPAAPSPSRLFQVDLIKPTSDAVLGSEVLEEVRRGVALLQRLTPRAQDEALSQFRTRFLERYEQREVPLLEALDEELGVGFGVSSAPGTEGAPLLAGLAFPAAPSEGKGEWDARSAHLLALLAGAWRSGAQELVLGEEDLAHLEAREPQPLPDAFAVMGSLLGESEEAVGRGEFHFVFDAVAGPSGALLLGRFCHGDAELSRLVQDHLQEEEALRPDAAFAEVVHLPEGRLGNVLCRPVLRGYELPFLGRSGAPPERQLPLSDLTVSVRGDRVVLRSSRLGREVLPRLTTAHNFSRGLGVYRFLCALQDRSAVGFSWGPLAHADFLPRVRVGRSILALARWRLPERLLSSWGQAQGADRFRAVQAFREEARLPRYVALQDGDNELPVDLDNVLCVESLVQLVKGRPHATLVELPVQAAQCVRGPEGRFAHELVIPFVRGEAPRQQAPARPRLGGGRLRRTFPPGSEWLYAKLYAGTSAVDGLLRELVPQVVRPALDSGAADAWFFIRYADPAWHLRLRLHGPPERLRDEVLPRLERALEESLSNGSVWRLQLDTYAREVERYGGEEGMVLCERLFASDSEAALDILRALPGEEAAEGRWRLVLRGMDLLLEELGLDLPARVERLRHLRAAFGHEFRVDRAFERQLGERFRRERPALEGLLVGRGEEVGPLAEGLAALRRRSARDRPVMAALREAHRAGRLTLSLGELAASLLHMHANRLLRSAARAQELVLYDFLLRVYESRLARARRRGGRQAA